MATSDHNPVSGPPESTSTITVRAEVNLDNSGAVFSDPYSSSLDAEAGMITEMNIPRLLTVSAPREEAIASHGRQLCGRRTVVAYLREPILAWDEFRHL